MEEGWEPLPIGKGEILRRGYADGCLWFDGLPGDAGGGDSGAQIIGY